MNDSFKIPTSIFSNKLQSQLIALRRDLHRHPELSLQEERTSQKLYETLEQLHPKDLRKVAGTGVVARVAGKDPDAPTVALRGDIDALPIQEATGLDFASEKPGVMHACGHDVHATWTVGAACLLAEKPAVGDVLVILQPAEEIGQGARAILATGALDDARAIFGAHVDRRFEVGKVVVQEGPLAASSDTFEIELTGKGAHGARPQESADPVVCAASLVSVLQTIVARRLNPADAGVISVGSIHGGSAANIIPETVQLKGTIRAIDHDTRRLLQEEIKHIAENTAKAHRVRINLVVHSGTPPIVNPPEPVAWARKAAINMLGDETVVPLGMLNMAGEDFACYMESIPGCFLRIGAREPDGQIIPAHSPQFYAAEESIFVGAAVLAETARVASTALAKSK